MYNISNAKFMTECMYQFALNVVNLVTALKSVKVKLTTVPTVQRVTTSKIVHLNLTNQNTSVLTVTHLKMKLIKNFPVLTTVLHHHVLCYK